MISIVVPVYNKKRYLTQCLESISCQTLEYFECLLIDDGSTDGSSSLCDEFCLHDPRFRVIHKDNGGLSDARNAGIAASQGDYITFIDADDYVCRNYLETLTKLMHRFNADISCGCMCVGELSVPPDSVVEKSFSCRDALVEQLYGREVGISTCGKLYKKSLFNGICFPFGMSYEDVAISVNLVKRADTVAVSNYPIYFYMMNPDSITHNPNEHVFDRFVLAMDVHDLFKDMSDTGLRSAADRYLVYHCLSVLRTNYPRTPYTKKMEKRVLSCINCLKKNVLSDPNVPRRDIAALRIVPLGLHVYRFIWNAYALFHK